MRPCVSSSSRFAGRGNEAESPRDALERVLAGVPRTGSVGEALVEVERLLADPLWLAESRTLPAEHPWRAHGRLARDLLQRVTERSLDENDREALRGIPRRSPVAAWSLAIRMLDAAYAGRPTDALEIAERMPRTSPACAICDVVARVLRGEEPARGREARRLYDKLVPLPEMCRKRTREINAALGAGDPELAFQAARALHTRLRAAAPETMDDLRAVLAHELAAPETDPIALAEFLKGFGDRPKAYQQMALVYETMSPEVASYGWFEYLVHRRTEPIPESERVAVMRRLFTLVAPHEFGERSVPEPLLAGLESRRSSHLARLPMRRALQECLLEAQPTPETYRILLEHASDDGERERLVASWCEARSGDAEPHFLLARLRKRHAPRRALVHLESAERLGYDKARVERLRLELVVAAAEESIRRGKGAQALADLQALGRLDPRQPMAWRVHVAALTWFGHAVSGKGGKLRRTWSDLVRLCGDECTAFLWASAYPGWLEGSATERATKHLPVIETDGSSCLRAIVSGCLWAERLERAFDPWGLDPEACLEALETEGETLDGDALVTLVPFAERALRDDPGAVWGAFAFHLSARGLHGEERATARFLALRATWLLEACERVDLARECDLVAAWLAERWGERDLVRTILTRSFEGDWLGDLSTQAQRVADSVIVREREREADPEAGETCIAELERDAFDVDDLADPFEHLTEEALRERVAPFANQLVEEGDAVVLREVSQAFVREGFHVPSLERLRELARAVIESRTSARRSIVLQPRERSRRTPRSHRGIRSSSRTERS